MWSATDIESRELSGIREVCQRNKRWRKKCCAPNPPLFPRNETLQSAVWPEQEMTVEQQICQQELVSR